MFVTAAFVLAAAQLASVVGASSLGPPNANCYRETYRIAVSAENNVFTNVTVPAGTDNTTFVASLNQQFATQIPNITNFLETHLSGGATKPVQNTYKISGTLCTPKAGVKDASAIQLLIHGIGMSSEYWHFTSSDVPLNQSYVAAATDAGYITFRYDRLGTGQSEHPADGYNVVQAPTDIAIATKIAQSLKTGKLPGIQAFKKLTVVGHSYGSAQTTALTTVPGLVDHAVLTGFIAHPLGAQLFITGAGLTPANVVDPDRFGSLPHSYLMTVAPQTFQMFFLEYPFYTAAAGRLSRVTEDLTTQGTLFTFGTPPSVVPTYNGSITVVTAQQDVIMCAGNCLDVPMGMNVTSLLDTVGPLYPAASNFTTYMPKNMGHGISAHNESGTVHVWIQNHLASL